MQDTRGVRGQLQGKAKQAQRGGAAELEKYRNRGEPGQDVLPHATLGRHELMIIKNKIQVTYIHLSGK